MPGPRGPQGPKPKINNPGKLFGRLMQFILKNYWFHCLVVIICIFVSVIANVQGTLFMQTLIDDYITPLLKNGGSDYAPLLHAMGRVAIFYGIGVLSTFVYNKLMIYVSQGSIKRMRDELFTHMQDLPIRYFDTHSHGDIMSVYTNDIDTLRQLISQSIPQMINSAITVIMVLISMIRLNVPLTVLTLFMVFAMIFLTKIFAGSSSKFFLSQQRDLGQVNGFIEEMLNGQKVIKVFTHEEESIEQFDELNEKLFESAYHANWYSSLL